MSELSQATKDTGQPKRIGALTEMLPDPMFMKQV
jgi:hypothetical protein